MKKILLLVIGLGAFAALGQFSIDWFSVGGGSGSSSGGTFAVVGVIAQPDAGPMSGGTFAVTGGLLALPTAVQTPNAPTLAIVPCTSPGRATISWTPATPDFVLQETAHLTPVNWVTSPSGTNNPVTLSTTASAKFYRLFKL